jgi:hypothetical protein
MINMARSKNVETESEPVETMTETETESVEETTKKQSAYDAAKAKSKMDTYPGKPVSLDYFKYMGESGDQKLSFDADDGKHYVIFVNRQTGEAKLAISMPAE